MTGDVHTGGLPLELVDTHPVPCLHVREPGRLREYTVVSGGRVWNLCSECKARLEMEWHDATRDHFKAQHDLRMMAGKGA